jgi:glycosyltransferase involved in cell wall biosynthesis
MNMKIAFVYDRVNKYGGAERVLEALHSIWPEAPLYTAVYDRKGAPWAGCFDVRPTFLNHIPFAKHTHELFPWATPLAFESISFDEYDVVISVTSAEAKGIITKPHTLHICYCLTPTRYLWSGYEEYLAKPGLGIFGTMARAILRRNISKFREDDFISAQRPDVYIAISEVVKKRIETYYKRNVEKVIYPPVRNPVSEEHIKLPAQTQPFYLTVARFVGYKRVDIVVSAFTKLGLPLVVIGSGWEKRNLKKKAGPTIRFIDNSLTDEELAGYYKSCRAFVFAGVEDLGLVSVEAQSYGKPVITYRHSGMAETITDGKTGILFDTQTPEALIRAVKHAEGMTFNADDCRNNAEKFALARFKRTFYDSVHRMYLKGKGNTL